MGLGEYNISICKDTKPHLSVEINLNYNDVMPKCKGLRKLGKKDLESMVSSSFDKIFFMAYHRQVAREMDRSVRKAIEISFELTSQLSQRLPLSLLVQM